MEENIIEQIEKIEVAEGDLLILYTNAKSFQKVDQIRESLAPFCKKKSIEILVLQMGEGFKKVIDKDLFNRVSMAEKTISKIKSLLTGSFFLDKTSRYSEEWMTGFLKNIDALLNKYFGEI